MIESTTTHVRPAASTATSVSGPRTLDDLAALDVAELEAVYRRGTVPPSLHALDGNPVCRMLAIRGLDAGARARTIRNLARASWFPWAGKSFAAETDATGNGINRIRLAGGKRWFPFKTLVEPSAIDGAPCIFLDYRLAANPRPIQMIRDELREVAPGLFLGPAMLDTGNAARRRSRDQRQGLGETGARLVLWFACHVAN
jgi:hypothetical protein